MARLKKFLNEARGMRADKIGMLFQYTGDNKKYILQQIEDIPIKQYNDYTDGIRGSIVKTINKLSNRSKYFTVISFISEKGNKRLILIRFIQKIAKFQGKDIGMKLANSSESLKIKPQDFKILSTMKYNNYVNHVRMMIDILFKNDIIMNEYLKYLMDYTINGKGKTNVDIKTLPLNQIGKNFGEILGPMALFNDSNLYTTKFDKSSDNILMPTAGNEKLLDFIIEKDGIKHNFSAKYKKGAASSLSSVYDIIQKYPNEFIEYSNEINTLDVIMKNKSSQAPTILCNNWGFINSEQWIAWNNKEYNSPVWSNLKETKPPFPKNMNKVDENKPYWITAIMAYMCADYMNTSNFNFDGLILKSIKLVSVVQINMKLTSKGVPSFKVIGSDIDKVKAIVDAKKGYFTTDTPKQRLSFKIQTK
jgi:hypothetical protein